MHKLIICTDGSSYSHLRREKRAEQRRISKLKTINKGGLIMSTTTQKLLNLASNPYQQSNVKTESDFSLEAKALAVFSQR